MHHCNLQYLNHRLIYNHISFYDNLSRCHVEVQLRTKEMDDYAEIGPADNNLINDGCGLYRGRLILPYEHLSKFQNDLID